MDDDIQVCAREVHTKCPITQETMDDPSKVLRNILCGHHYSKEGIMLIIQWDTSEYEGKEAPRRSSRIKKKKETISYPCPISGCPTRVSKSVLVEDPEYGKKILEQIKIEEEERKKKTESASIFLGDSDDSDSDEDDLLQNIEIKKNKRKPKKIKYTCSYCEEEIKETPILCSRCEKTVYCSDKCKGKDWGSHKKNCILSKTSILNSHEKKKKRKRTPGLIQSTPEKDDDDDDESDNDDIEILTPVTTPLTGVKRKREETQPKNRKTQKIPIEIIELSDDDDDEEIEEKPKEEKKDEEKEEQIIEIFDSDEEEDDDEDNEEYWPSIDLFNMEIVKENDLYSTGKKIFQFVEHSKTKPISIVKNWELKNSGSIDWNNVTCRWLDEGNSKPGTPCHVESIPFCAVGNTCKFEMYFYIRDQDITINEEDEKYFVTKWRLFDEHDRPFGEIIECKLKIKTFEYT